jgi:hypothetical protein
MGNRQSTRRWTPLAGSILALGTAASCVVDGDVSCNDRGYCPDLEPTAGAAGAGGSSAGAAGSGGDGQSAGAGSGGKAGASSGGGPSGGSPNGGNSSGSSGSGGTAGEGGGGAGTGGGEPCDGKCGGSTPVCKLAANECVECTEDDDAACTDLTPLCDTVSNTCVECLTDTHCTDPAASRCNAGICKPCTVNGQCTHIAGRTVCDTLDGECVQCTGTDYTACGEDSAGGCTVCVSDAHCQLGQVCALERFGDPPQNVGYFCFWKQGDTANGAPGDCFSQGRPYVGVALNASSIDGQVADICTLRTSTCVARNQFSDKNCGPTPNNALCGFAPPEDARCDQVGVSANFQCTMRCGSSIDCPPGFSCNTGALQPYCEL